MRITVDLPVVMTAPATSDDNSESPPESGLSGIVVARAPRLKRILAVAERVNIPMLASALTFDAILAMIPFGILAIGGLGYLLDRTEYFGTADPSALVTALFPVVNGGRTGPDPVAVMEQLLKVVTEFRPRLTLVAVPLFAWFATRLFSSARNTLSQIYEAKDRQRHSAMVLDYILGFVFGKLRDLGVIAAVMGVALATLVISSGLMLLPDGTLLPSPLSFLATTLGRVVREAVAIGSTLAFFTAIYRYATPLRVPWRGALLGATVATIGFDIAKRLFGLYLGMVSGGSGVYAVDAGIGAMLLFLLWVWYTAMVFLIGGAAVKVWLSGR